jgi:hypothetical protein
MTEGTRPILDRPYFYEFYPLLIGAKYRNRVLVGDYNRPRPDDRILGIGCQPGNGIPFPAECHFLGVDANESYIIPAQNCSCHRAKLIC